jgi:hypothetical protein
MNNQSNQIQLQCEKCKSTYFSEVPFKQYRQQYSSLPGGDVSPHTENPVRVLICLCGNPIPPGRLRSYAPKDYESFQKSFEAAQQYREKINPQAIMRIVDELYAGLQQSHARLEERIANLQTILEEPLPPSLPKPPKP